MAAIVANVGRLVGRGERLGRRARYQRQPGRSEFRFGGFEIAAGSHRQAAGEVNLDIPEPDAGIALGGETDPADALAALKARNSRGCRSSAVSIVAAWPEGNLLV